MNEDFYQSMQHNLAESNAYFKEKIEFIFKEAGEGNKILDAGCFDGIIGKMLIKKGNIVYGLDVVLLGDVIEHVFDTDSFLTECRRALKKNGKLILTTPNVASLERRIMLMAGVSPFLEFSSKLPANGAVFVGHIRYYTVSTLIDQLRYNRFKEIKVQGDQLNLGFLRVGFFGKRRPSLCAMLLCTAIKK